MEQDKLLSGLGVRSPQLDDNSSSDSFVFAPDTNDNDAATNGTKIDSSDDDDHDEDDYEDQDDETEEMEGVGAGFFRAPRALGPNAALWDDPKGADVVIFCKDSVWEVHRHVLVSMSEYWEKYLPPAPEDGGMTRWRLDNWDVAQLGTILKFMYFETYDGGDYDPRQPLNAGPILVAVGYFMAGSACLCRPLMDLALSQLEAFARDVKLLVADQIRYKAHIDYFEQSLRRAMIMMYDEPDQWRIRALRVTMGRVMDVCFPIVLRHPRWERAYQYVWGNLRLRIVADHRWLMSSGTVEQNDIILEGFHKMQFLWVKYRPDGWVPADDEMFPERAASRDTNDRPTSPPSPTPTPKRKSKAIPIMRPDGTPMQPPKLRGRKAQATGTGLVQPAPQPAARGQGSKKKKDKGKSEEIEESAKKLDPGKQVPEYAPTQPLRTTTPPYSPSSANPAAALMAQQLIPRSTPHHHYNNNNHNSHRAAAAAAVAAAAAAAAIVALPPPILATPWQQQLHTAMGYPPRFPIYDRPAAAATSPEKKQQPKQPVFTAPFLPGGPSHFPETSTGEPADGSGVHSVNSMSFTLFSPPLTGPAPSGVGSSSPMRHVMGRMEEMNLGGGGGGRRGGHRRSSSVVFGPNIPGAAAFSAAANAEAGPSRGGHGRGRRN